MGSSLDTILQTILGSDDVESPECQVCEIRIHAYVDAELEGEDAAKRYPAIQAHLESCTRCREAYEEVKRLLLQEQQGQFLEPPIEPAFDFSYLDTIEPKVSMWERVDRLGKEIDRLVVQVRLVISQQVASFSPLPSPLKPSWVEVPALRGDAAEPDKDLQHLFLPSPERDVQLRLLVGPASEGVIALGLQMTRSSSDQPVARARVMLRDEKGRVLVGDLTDSEGRVAFPRIGSGSYLLEARHKDQAWELPISIAPEGEPE